MSRMASTWPITVAAMLAGVAKANLEASTALEVEAVELVPDDSPKRAQSEYLTYKDALAVRHGEPQNPSMYGPSGLTENGARIWLLERERALAELSGSSSPWNDMHSPSTSAILGAPLEHRLVIVEGIMGSGKSTTMRFIAKSLQDANRAAVPIHEKTDPHPVRATDELEHWFEPWLDTTPSQLAARSVARWASLVEASQADGTIRVMDGQLFHGDLTNLFLMDADPPTLTDHALAVATTIAPLNPLVVYFRQEDVERAIRTVSEERGADWVAYQVNWKLAAPYSVRRGLVGLEGLIAAYQDYRRLTDDLFERLPLDKLAIQNAEQAWPAYQRIILQALGLPAGTYVQASVQC